MNAPIHCGDCARLLPTGPATQVTRDAAGYPCCPQCLRARADRERWAAAAAHAAQAQEPGDCDLPPAGSVRYSSGRLRRRRGEL